MLLLPVLLAISSGNIFQSTIISSGYMVMIVKGRLLSSGNIFQSTLISTGYMVMVVKGRLHGETSVTAK